MYCIYNYRISIAENVLIITQISPYQQKYTTSQILVSLDSTSSTLNWSTLFLFLSIHICRYCKIITQCLFIQDNTLHVNRCKKNQNLLFFFLSVGAETRKPKLQIKKERSLKTKFKGLWKNYYFYINAYNYQ